MSDDESDADFIDYHLGSARVFRAYGFCDKAWDEYALVLKRFPDNAEASQELLSLDWNADAHRRLMFKEMTGRDWPPEDS